MFSVRFLSNIVLIAFLVILQVFIFSRMTFANVATPFIYIIFILLYPPQKSQYIYLILCFLLGWGVDIFQDTGGIHALASITVALFRNPILRMISGGKLFDIEDFRFSDLNVGKWFIYTLLMVVIHHFLLLFLESFSISNINVTLLKSAYSSAFTLIFVYFYLILFRKSERR